MSAVFNYLSPIFFNNKYNKIIAVKFEECHSENNEIYNNAIKPM